MHSCFQDIFVTCDDHQEVQYEGTRHGNHWGNGVLRMSNGRTYARVHGGVPLFVPPEQDPWDDEVVGLSKNWRNSARRLPQAKYNSWIERIVAQGGLILIVACGPGGSHSRPILSLNPEARLIMNDIGKWIVVEWKRFAEEKGIWPYLSCAQFDARCFPIRDGCLDCVDSSGAMVEINPSFPAMSEAFRVLKPGGKLFLSEGMLDPECIRQFPEEARQELYDIQFNLCSTDYRERLTALGFKIIPYEQSGHTTPNLGESTLANMSTKYGVEIRMFGVTIEAQKPLDISD